MEKNQSEADNLLESGSIISSDIHEYITTVEYKIYDNPVEF
jgi:hypothetical protein